MSKTRTPQNPSAADATRLALVMAALKLFGRQGFDGTSTREIATAANANIGSIAYHFGGKDGLPLRWFMAGVGAATAAAWLAISASLSAHRPLTQSWKRSRNAASPS